MSVLLLAVHKAKVVERLSNKEKRHICSHCGTRNATIKLALPNLRPGFRIYRFMWYCERCYKEDYAKSLKDNPDASDLSVSRKELKEMFRKGTFLTPRATEHLREMRKEHA